MTNKLKLTTALAGSLMVLGATSANAQTYYKDGISGNLAISYQATKSENKANSYRTFGKESQFNLAASGALNNGWNYKAGTSIEMDGGDGTTAITGNQAESPTVSTLTSQQSENTFIDFINGNTTITIGADHLAMSDTNSYSNHVGFGYIGADGVNNTRSLYPTNLSNYQAYGIGIVQTTGIGKFSANYTPSASNGQSANDIFNGNGKDTGQKAESAYELVYQGNLGLNGLSVLGSYMSAQRMAVGNSADAKSTRVGVKYNFGSFTVGADRSREENVQAMTTKAATQKYNGDSVGVSYAVNKELSIGATYAEAKSDLVTTNKKESTTIVAVGYNLGPVAVVGQYKNAQNVGGTTNGANDGQQVGVWVNTSF